MHDSFAVIRWGAAGIGPGTAGLLWSPKDDPRELLISGARQIINSRATPRTSISKSNLCTGGRAKCHVFWADISSPVSHLEGDREFADSPLERGDSNSRSLPLDFGRRKPC